MNNDIPVSGPPSKWAVSKPPGAQDGYSRNWFIAYAIRQFTRLARAAALAVALVVTVPLAAHAADTQAPSVPTGLRMTAVSSTSITLAWDASWDNVGVKGYYVYLNDEPLSITTATTFQHTNLIPGTKYIYRVSAYDAVPNHSAWSPSPISVTTQGAAQSDSSPPSVPTGLTASAVSNTQITLSWNASTDNVGVKGYYVYYNDKPLGTTPGTTFQHTGLTPGTTYKYRVSAYDAVPNHSAWSPAALWVVTTTVGAPDTTPPSIPTGLKATVSGTQVNLSWNASTDNVGVKGYNVYYNDKFLGTTPGTTFQHTGLTPGNAYSYRVSAFDAVSNNSAWTATPVWVTLNATGPAPISGAAQFVATFPSGGFRNGTGDGMSNDGIWWVEQKAGTNRAYIVNTGRDGSTGLLLHTEPGDNNVSGSGSSERNDVAMSQATTDGYQGREHWWAHSIMFPSDYAMPPAGTWATVFDFHDSRNQGGQANFHIFVLPDGHLSFRGHGGPTVVQDATGNQYSYGADIGALAKNTWYDFVYHVKWSSGGDGYMQAWVNGVLVLDHYGPTLYSGYGVFLKLANYHGAFGQSSSIVHDRVVRGATALSVAPGPLNGVLTMVNGVLTPVR